MIDEWATVQAPVGRAYFSRITTGITAMFALALRYKLYLKYQGGYLKCTRKQKSFLQV
jgi:hypothetical protein